MDQTGIGSGQTLSPRVYPERIKHCGVWLARLVGDKHRVKVGEPSCPVAAAERGRQVIVRSGTNFQVSDHDFTRFSVIPSVALIVDVPDVISESWYEGSVHMLYKDSAFEASSPVRHATELAALFRNRSSPILFLYSDGGPDHRVIYMSVKLSLISLFVELDPARLC